MGFVSKWVVLKAVSLEEMSYEENITGDESLGSSPGEYKFRGQEEDK